MTNQDVVRAWRRGYNGSSNNMMTDGDDLFSYAHKIGFTDPEDGKVAICCHYSVTTAHHSTLAKREATTLTECPAHSRKECKVYRATVVPGTEGE